MLTFYMAGSSARRGEIASRMSELRSLGLRVWNGHDWTQYGPEKPGMAENANLVSKDLLSSINADLFVFYMHADVISCGGWAEYGARISRFKAAHVVLNGAPWHLFTEHGHATVHENWESFLVWLLEQLPPVPLFPSLEARQQQEARLGARSDRLTSPGLERIEKEQVLSGPVRDGILLRPLEPNTMKAEPPSLHDTHPYLDVESE